MEKHQEQSENLLEIKNLNFSFGVKEVLTDFSFTLKRGQVHGILGDNGAGKTTFFNLLFGTLKSTSAALEGIDRTAIAFLETDSYLYSHMTGMEYIQLIAPDTNSLEKWNEIFELPMNEYAHNYSTGMKKKLLLLGVLLLNKNIIILDEPFNGLDLKTCEAIHYIIQRLKAVGKTIILSSHILETVIQNADEISYLENGSILKTYDKNEFMELEELVKGKFRNSIVSKIDELIKNNPS
jgi:ABC-2 type transport system ATP-binding protein